MLKPINNYLVPILVNSVKSLPRSAKKKELMRMYELGLLSAEETEFAIKLYKIENA